MSTLLRVPSARAKRSCASFFGFFLAMLIGLGALCGVGEVRAQELLKSFEDLEKKEQKSFKGLLEECASKYSSGADTRSESKRTKSFKESLLLCQSARDILPHPVTYYIEARILDRSASCQKAADIYQRLLSLSPPEDWRSEFDWYRENRELIKEHSLRLGDCTPRLVGDCKTQSGWVVTTGEGVWVGRCGEVQGVSAGSHQVTLVGVDRDPSSAQNSVIPEAGEPVKFRFEALPKQASLGAGHQLKVSCNSFSEGAALLLDGEVLGACPRTFTLSAGEHRLDGYGANGEKGSLFLRTKDLEDGAERELPLLEQVSLTCATPTVNLSIEVPELGAPVVGRCAEIAAAGGLFLPAGTYAVVLEEEGFDSSEISLTVQKGKDSQLLNVGELREADVPFTLACPEGEDPSQPTHARIGGVAGACPLSGQLPKGHYEVELRREGSIATTMSIELSPDSSRTQALGAPPSRPFFTVGSITALSGGVILLAGLGVDLASVSELQELKDLSASGSGEADLLRHTELVDSVNTNIATTQILYGVGLSVALVGGGLWIYEMLDWAPGDFSKNESQDETLSWSLVPVFLPEEGAGAMFQLTF